ncbi:unnamed protein product, partial [Ectocarpus sp. 13 AM-2016]
MPAAAAAACKAPSVSHLRICVKRACDLRLADGNLGGSCTMILFCEGMDGFRGEGGRKKSLNDMSVRLGSCGNHPTSDNKTLCLFFGKTQQRCHPSDSPLLPFFRPLLPRLNVFFARGRFANPLF